jgi:hypothetical protein
MQEFGSAVIVNAPTIPLALGLVGDVYVITKIVDSPTVGLIAGSLARFADGTLACPPSRGGVP